MNKYQHKVNMARIKYPLKTYLVLNPAFMMIVNEYGKESIESRLNNEVELTRFLVTLEMYYEREKEDSLF